MKSLKEDENGDMLEFTSKIKVKKKTRGQDCRRFSPPFFGAAAAAAKCYPT